MADWQQLQTPERIRCNAATRTARRRKKELDDAELKVREAREAYRAALTEQISATAALNNSLRGRRT